MKTPDKIKKGLAEYFNLDEVKRHIQCCADSENCLFCSFFEEGCDKSTFLRLMLNAVQQLEAQNAELVQKMQQLEAKVPKWISAKEPPEKWKTEDGTLVNYQIYMPEYGVDVGNYHAPSKTWVCVGLPANVTHWMPLPEPPEV